MKAIPIHTATVGSYLAQNLFRHDGLLMYPKGIRLRRPEIEAIAATEIGFVLVEEKEGVYKEDDFNLTLQIIQAAYCNATLWNKKIGKELADGLEKLVIKNKKIRKYLNELRSLDTYSFVHCINVSMIIASLLLEDQKVDKDVIYISFLTLMHDIGRIKMKQIFSKEGKLTEEEFKELRKHPQYSYDLLKNAGFDDSELGFVLEHHEKFDGSGYPHKLRGFEIQDLAQLVLIADFYNGLSSDRPYRKAFAPEEVVEMIVSEKKFAFGDRHIAFFLEKFTPYPVGTHVELTNGDEARVKEANISHPLFPIVEVISEKMMSPISVNLAMEKGLSIRRVITSY
jgi:HD-GYP domain-containing protein (c-di-GMP phosphodiesterase class II)